MKVFNISDPSVFRSQAYKLKCSPLGVMQLEEYGKPLTFVEMQKLRTAKSPDEMRQELEDGECTLANVGVTVFTIVSYQGADYAVFTRRPNGQLAHICGYTSAGVSFADMAKAELAEELIVKLGDRYLSNTNLPFAYASVVDVEIATWPFAISEGVKSMTAPVARSGAMLVNDGTDSGFVSGELSPKGLYLDPFTSSAQRLFYARIELPDLPITLLQTEETLKSQSDGTFVLKASEGQPIWLFPIVGDGNGDAIDVDRAFTLIDGKLCPMDISNAEFHQGMARVDCFGICQSESVLASRYFRHFDKRVVLGTKRGVAMLEELGYSNVPLALVELAHKWRYLPGGWTTWQGNEITSAYQIVRLFRDYGVPDEISNAFV
jgi:hypothetical protein